MEAERCPSRSVPRERTKEQIQGNKRKGREHSEEEKLGVAKQARISLKIEAWSECRLSFIYAVKTR